MGDKAARSAGLVGSRADEVVGLLAPLGEVRWKAMFGGAGIVVEDRMVALLDSAGQLHLKVGQANRQRDEEAGAVKHARMPYYRVPEPVLGDDALLLEWARESADLAR